jgi:hypothetical protein
MRLKYIGSRYNLMMMTVVPGAASINDACRENPKATNMRTANPNITDESHLYG